MAGEADVQADPSESARQEPQAAEKAATPRKSLPWKWIGIAAGVSVVNFAVGFACCRVLTGTPPVDRNPEVSLGSFRFRADRGDASSVADAEFTLHIALLDQVDQLARGQLETHKYRLRQKVEELLRQAHGADFEDPELGGLKRQLQEQVNETLGMRVIADVIITDLELDRGDATAKPQSELAGVAAWAEGRSGLASGGETPAGH
ncbi:MAG: hypothetical protein A2V70_09475 [Planctomycetes bacterium RBG_13_63_9]|nr:MAG: hypothetical protein A2V70_09475 [Planctomycetes bacterium RBG_13_63_9]